MKISRAYSVEGIILKRRSVGEADRILTVFTRQYGKIRVIAKGIRKISSRRAGHLEVFTYVTLQIHAGRTMDSVTEAQTIISGTLLGADVTKVGYAYCLCELVDQLLPERQEHGDVLILLRDALFSLQRSEDESAWQKDTGDFIHKLLWILGFLPSSRRIPEGSLQSYIEHITERKLKTWSLLTTLRAPS